MTNKFIFYFFLFIAMAFSCKQNESGTYNYALLKVDTNKINIFKWDTLLNPYPKFSEPLPLTNDDIKLADSLLINAVEQFNQTNSKGLCEAFNKQVSIDSFTIDLSKYKRQYFPYKDNNGQRVLRLVCFSKMFPEWRNKIYYGGTGDGIYKFYLRINLSGKKADDFSIGGNG